jgi:AcrR family transcriptional regulator
MNTEQRRRNRKGQGDLLRQELIAAAAAVLRETGDENGLSIREVARRVSVTPPAVYLHFPNKEALVEAVLRDRFTALLIRLRDAITGIEDPAISLRAGCLAYLRFAAEDPGSYRVLFGGRSAVSFDQDNLTDGPGGPTFAALVRGVTGCQRTGAIPPGDPHNVATLLWIALHGAATLPQARSSFPWPPMENLLDDLLERVAGLRRA